MTEQEKTLRKALARKTKAELIEQIVHLIDTEVSNQEQIQGLLRDNNDLSLDRKNARRKLTRLEEDFKRLRDAMVGREGFEKRSGSGLRPDRSVDAMVWWIEDDGRCLRELSGVAHTADLLHNVVGTVAAGLIGQHDAEIDIQVRRRRADLVLDINLRLGKGLTGDEGAVTFSS